MTKSLMRGRHSAGGFTLVELLAAAALSTLLLTVGFAVTRSLAVRPGRDALDHAAWRLAAERQIRWDLEHAVLAQPPRAGALVIAGYGGINVAAGEVAHLPVTVEYRIQTIGDRRWLVRQQTWLEAGPRSRTLTQLVCADVSDLVVIARVPTPRRGAQGRRDRADFTDALPAALQQLRGFEPAPSRCRVSVVFRSGVAPLVVEVSR